MSTNIPQVGNTSISHAIFIDLTLNANFTPTTYYFSSAYKPITINGNTYNELGALLGVGSISDNLKVTNSDLQIVLSGIPSDENYMDEVLSYPIKGGEVVVRRGFFDINTLQPISGAVYERYRGIITNYAVSEETDFNTGSLVNSIAISCSSINAVLENKISGQRTTGTDRKRFFPGDISFDRVKDLQNTAFDFGKKFTGGQGYGGQGGGGGGGGGRGFEDNNFNER
jgi:hypothetical protein